MKIGFCVSAFFMGCFMTVFMKNSSPSQPVERTISELTVLAEDVAAPPEFKMDVVKQAYGSLSSGESIHQFICTNVNGYSLEMIDFGGTITAFRAPDRDGKIENVVLGCNEIAGYELCNAYFGSTVGRYANRISKARFSIEGREFQLYANDGPNHLHGGKIGFDKRIWQAEEIRRETDGVLDEVGIRFSLLSTDGEEGYPGNLNVAVEYTLNNDNELKIDYFAECDQRTHVNLTNHCYWNLAGAGAANVLNHQLQLNADEYITVDGQSIPTGIESVDGTPFDFRVSTPIGQRMDQVVAKPQGYDHCFVLRKTEGGLEPAGVLVDPKSGRQLELFTTQRGVQVYTGNYLNGQPSSGGFDQHQAVCLETQAFPDSPNVAEFPTTLLQPGCRYRQTTVHRFSVQ